jgi:hypothetical protein
MTAVQTTRTSHLRACVAVELRTQIPMPIPSPTAWTIVPTSRTPSRPILTVTASATLVTPMSSRRHLCGDCSLWPWPFLPRHGYAHAALVWTARNDREHRVPIEMKPFAEHVPSADQPRRTLRPVLLHLLPSCLLALCLVSYLPRRRSFVNCNSLRLLLCFPLCPSVVSVSLW